MSRKLPIIGILAAAFAMVAFAQTNDPQAVARQEYSAGQEDAARDIGKGVIRYEIVGQPGPKDPIIQEAARQRYGITVVFHGCTPGPRVDYDRGYLANVVGFLTNKYSFDPVAKIEVELREQKDETNATDAEIFDRLSQRLRTAVPNAVITTNDTTLTAAFQTMSFKIHGRFMTGEVAKDAHDEVGPTHTGFMLSAYVQPKGEVNQAVTPQTLQRPYWLSALDVAPVAGSERQLYWSLSYGSRTDTNTLAKLRAAVRSLGTTPAFSKAGKE